MILRAQIDGLPEEIKGLCDGGAETPLISCNLYESMDPKVKPKLRETDQRICSLFPDPETGDVPIIHPIGEVTLKITLPDFNLAVEFDFVVADISDPLIFDSSFMNYTQIDNHYHDQTLSRGTTRVKVATRVSRVKVCRRIQLAESWVIPPNTRQLVPGAVKSSQSDTNEQTWLVEPPRTVRPERPVIIGRTLCTNEQCERNVIPVEVTNFTSEPVHLYRNTTLGLLSPTDLIPGLKPLQVTHSAPNEDSDNDATPIRKVTISKDEKVIVLPQELEDMIKEAKAMLTKVQWESLRDLVYRYSHIFALKDQPLGQTNVVLHDIDTGDSRPIKCRARRTPIGIRDEALKEEKKMLEMGVIEPSDSPWASPVVLVRKKDHSLRYCIDYRKLNEVTKRDSYPLPNMQDCLESLAGTKCFSTMDLSSGYWQVGLSEDAQDKSSFYGVRGGLWKFKVMPFGLTNAPATFERLMERVLGQLQWQICLCYIDDVLVFSKTVEQHLANLEAVFIRLDQAGLKLKPKKCHFFREKVKFLGHVVSSEGISTDPDKIDKVKNCPNPKNVHEVKSITGLCSYYRQFIPSYSDVVQPVQCLVEKGRPFVWGERQEESFKKLKELLTEAPVLAYPQNEGLFILDTDASNVGIGCVLSQLQNGEERVIAYGSRALTKTERNYCITRRELLAVVHFTKHFQHFLLGRQFKVRTDNSAVKYMKSLAYEPFEQKSRWLEKLANFDFVTEHRPGSKHQNADSLSRPPFVVCAQCHIKHKGGLKSKRELQIKAKAEAKIDEQKAVVGQVRLTSALPTDVGPSHVDIQPDSVPKRIGQSAAAGSARPVGRLYSEQFSCQSAATAKTISNPKLFTADSEVSLRPAWQNSHSKRFFQSSLLKQGNIVFDEINSGKKVSAVRLRRPRGQGARDAPSSWLQGGVKLDRNLVRDEQWKDPACIDALIWLRQGSKPSKEEVKSLSSTHKFLWATFDSLKDENGLLVRKIKPVISGAEQTVVIVPESLRREAISKCHDAPTSGHFYYWKTLKLAKRYFIWPGMGKDIQNYCLSCHVCATRKKAGRNRRAHMKHYDVGLPMEEICIDLAGPFPETHNSNKYVLVVVDSFSKWMEAYPLPDIEAKTVAETLVREFISRFGVPFWLKSDQGRQFESKLFQEMCNIMELEHKTSTAFHPQGNSRVERMVKVVVNLMAAYCNDQKDWDTNLPLLTLAYRSTIHEVTGYTPNYLMLGREVFLPLDIMVGTIPGDQRLIAPEYIAKLKERLQDSFKVVRDNLRTYAEQNKKYYDLRSHGDDFESGNLVYVMKKTRQKGVSPKLDAKWKGPYVVVKKFGTIYEVQINRQTSKLYHFDLLKPCFSDINSVAPWLKRAQKKLLKD